MKTIVIYHSQTGFTKRYAEWIATVMAGECLPLSKAKTVDFEKYDAVVFGGYACAGTMSKLKWFKANMDKWAGKKLVVYSTGGSPIYSPDIPAYLDSLFTEEEREKVFVCYCPAGINYEGMGAGSRMMMKLFRKVCEGKKDKTDADLAMIEMLSKSYDIADEKYIDPILEYLRGEPMRPKSKEVKEKEYGKAMTQEEYEAYVRWWEFRHESPSQEGDCAGSANGLDAYKEFSEFIAKSGVKVKDESGTQGGSAKNKE